MSILHNEYGNCKEFLGAAAACVTLDSLMLPKFLRVRELERKKNKAGSTELQVLEIQQLF